MIHVKLRLKLRKLTLSPFKDLRERENGRLIVFVTSCGIIRSGFFFSHLTYELTVGRTMMQSLEVALSLKYSL